MPCPSLPVPTCSAIETSVEVLLEGVSAGRTEAFAGLYDRMAPAVYGIAKRVLRNAAMAEEVTQEALLDVWVTSRSFDPARGSARSWILTIAHRRAVDAVRTEQASRDREERISPRSWERAFDTVAETALQGLADARVRVALETLTDLQRRAIQLAYFGGFTHREIAEILDVPLGTAKSRINSGLRRLRTVLPDVEMAAADGGPRRERQVA